MTYREALDNGYRVTDKKLQMGYVSRKVNMDDQPVLTAGGNRQGDLYVLAPNWDTTRFCLRVYLSK